MKLEELLARDGELTPEERLFMERELVKATRALHACLQQIAREAAASEPRVAARLRRSADSMLENVEKAAALPWPDGTPGALAD